MNVRDFITGIVAGLVEGGPGSGHWGHAGRKGVRGGSLPSKGGLGSAMSLKSGPTAEERRLAAKGQSAPQGKEQWLLPPRFRTVAEAEEWVREREWANTVSFKGFSLEAAQGFVDSLARNKQMDVHHKMFFENLGNNREINRISREQRRAHAEEMVTRLGYKKGDADYEWEVEQFLRKDDMRMARNAWAQYMSGSMGVRASILMAYDFARKGAKAEPDLQRSVDVKWHPVGTASYKAIIDHEAGHFWASHVLTKNAQQANSLFAQHRRTAKEELSEYAAKNVQEFLAEGWAEYLNNPQPRPLAREIGQLIEEEIRR